VCHVIAVCAALRARQMLCLLLRL